MQDMAADVQDEAQQMQNLADEAMGDTEGDGEADSAYNSLSMEQNAPVTCGLPIH
jgi:hypothetical protein